MICGHNWPSSELHNLAILGNDYANCSLRGRRSHSVDASYLWHYCFIVAAESSTPASTTAGPCLWATVPISAADEAPSADCSLRAAWQRLSENVGGRPAYKDEDQAAIWKRVNHVKEYSLIWSFRHSGRLDYTRLQKSHRVNHFPNNIMLTSKSRLSFLARSLHRKDPKGWEHMPRHFLLPEEKADFMSAVNDPHHRKRWVIKSRTHRGVRIFDASAAALRASTADGEEDVMAAEYVEPFLVSDHKFDIGVYIAITSIDPLEVYMYDNVLLRFCKLPHPRGEITPETPLESYVINDYQPPWEMEALREHHERGGGIPTKENKGFSHRAALSAHFESVGKSSKHFWQRVKEIVLDVLFEAERDMLVSLRKKTRNRRTCFELFRWDFLVNANGNPVLNEVNMSPNLQPKYFASGNDYWMKRGLVRDLLRMVGVGGWSQPEPTLSLEPEQGTVSRESSSVSAELWFLHRSALMHK